MKDPMIEQLVADLKTRVDDVNKLMKELDDLNVDVRISYIDRSKSKDITQGISLWRIEEHNNYL
jgi:flagellar hook-associated protein FlgK